MTFTEIVSAVMERTNQTSSDAQARIGRYVNERHRKVTSSVGLTPTRRVEVSANTVIGDPEVTFTNVVKILAVFDETSGNRRVLSERTFDEWRNSNTYAPASGPPQTFAISRMGASSVTVVLDPVPAAVSALKADALEVATTLSGSNVPDFPADFHDILIIGAIADELFKMEKQQSARAEANYELRLSELRMFLAKSAYLTIAQGGRSGMDRGAYWPAYTLPRRR